jgi:cytochrome c peroxidase
LLLVSATSVFSAQAAAQESSGGEAGTGFPTLPRILGTFPDSSGTFANATNNTSVVNRSNSFFDAGLGTNGQACVTCHQPSQGFSVIVPFIQAQFSESQGKDPLFRANDTATRPDADLSTLDKRRQAFQLALDLGLFRIGKTLPATAEFTVATQNTARFGLLPNPADPQSSGAPTLSLFRRPLATTNTRLDSVVLWDGRQNIHNLRTQVKAAARTLMLGSSVTDAQADSAASLMTSVFTAQETLQGAGSLSAEGAHGGADNLLNLATSASAPCVPMTDPAEAGTFVPAVPTSPGCTDPTLPFDLFTAWQSMPANTGRASVANGERIFNTRNLSFPGFPPFTCTACHTTTNVGNFPFVAPDNTVPNASLFVRYGLDSPEFLAHLASLNPRLHSFVERTAGLPVYTISVKSGADCSAAVLPNLITGDPIPGALTHSTDLGRAMVTGLCNDLGGFKPPILRGLATHAPYFHNGAAATIEDLVNFYDTIFTAHFSDQERADLAAFLRSL